jgi:hypothetical protein
VQLQISSAWHHTGLGSSSSSTSSKRAKGSSSCPAAQGADSQTGSTSRTGGVRMYDGAAVLVCMQEEDVYAPDACTVFYS